MVQLYKSDDVTEISKKIKTQWTSLGLEDVKSVNYSVLLNLPGPSPSSVTLSSSSQCFHPNGQPCNEEARKYSSQDLFYSYAAYSAKGTLEVIWPFVSVIYSEMELENNSFHLNWTNWQDATYKVTIKCPQCGSVRKGERRFELPDLFHVIFLKWKHVRRI